MRGSFVVFDSVGHRNVVPGRVGEEGGEHLVQWRSVDPVIHPEGGALPTTNVDTCGQAEGWERAEEILPRWRFKVVGYHGRLAVHRCVQTMFVRRSPVVHEISSRIPREGIGFGFRDP